MRIGIISEGHADRAVITNILTGITGIDTSNILALRPIDKYDETDKFNLDPTRFGGWTSVKEECETRILINEFLALEGQDFIVIHLDTAEADEYGIQRPDKSGRHYSETLRQLVIQQITKWLQDDLSSQLLYAISIEEIDAWLLTMYQQSDSSASAKPKEKLQKALRKKGLNSVSDYASYFVISKPFAKSRTVKEGKFLHYNYSLQAFYEEVEQKTAGFTNNINH